MRPILLAHIIRHELEEAEGMTGVKKSPEVNHTPAPPADKREDYTCRDCAQEQHSEHRAPEKAASRSDSRTDDITVFRDPVDKITVTDAAVKLATDSVNAVASISNTKR